MALTLYYHPLSSYCHKVLIALYESDARFHPHLIDLGSESDRALLSSHWSLCKFPVLHDSERKRSYPESTTIIEYLNRRCPAATPLIPTDPDHALDVRLWDRVLDNYVHTPMQQIVADRIGQTEADLSRQRALLRSAYRLIDEQVARQTWVAHERFSLADCAAAPALFYATTLEPLTSELRHLGSYFERLMERPSVRRTLEEAKPYFHMYPFAERLPERYRGGASPS